MGAHSHLVVCYPLTGCKLPSEIRALDHQCDSNIALAIKEIEASVCSYNTTLHLAP